MMLIWLIVSFYDVCGFWSVVLTVSVNRSFFTYIKLQSAASSPLKSPSYGKSQICKRFWTPSIIHGSLGPSESRNQRSLSIGSAVFADLTIVTDWQTDQRTGHVTPFVTIGRIDVRSTWMRPIVTNNISRLLVVLRDWVTMPGCWRTLQPCCFYECSPFCIWTAFHRLLCLALHTAAELSRDGVATEGHRDKDRGRVVTVLNGRVA